MARQHTAANGPRARDALATRALVATTAIQVAAACAALTVPSIAPVIAARLDVPASMVGTYLSLLYVGASTAALAGGGVVLRFGAVRLSQACLVACAVGLALTLLLCVSAGAMGLVSIAVAAVVVGVGYGPITPASSHVLAKTTPRERMALMFCIKQTGVPAGTALAGLVVPPLTVAFGWEVAVLLVALGCVAVALLAQPLRRASGRGARPHRATLPGDAGEQPCIGGTLARVGGRWRWCPLCTQACRCPCRASSLRTCIRRSASGW